MLFFFFFKQKTAYEIMPSLVGSEMCIRDRPLRVAAPRPGERRHRGVRWRAGARVARDGVCRRYLRRQRARAAAGRAVDRPRAVLDGGREPAVERAADPD